MLQFAIAPDVPSSTFNAGSTRHQGIEAGLDLALAPWARLRQVYQLNDFRFRDDAQYGDNRLPVVPKHQYRAELRLGTDTFSVTPNIEWTPKGAWTDYSNTTRAPRSEEHTSELQSLMRISYAVFCLKKKNKHNHNIKKIMKN